MWRDRSNLEKIIYFVLNDINKNGIVQDILKSNLLDSYINKAIISKALCLNFPLNYLSKSELQLVVFMVNKYYNNKINIDDYFIAKDSEKFELSYNPMLEFKNVLYSKNDCEESWIAIVTYKELYNMMKTGKLVYNVNIQMKGSLCRNSDKAIIIPYINEENIEIKKTRMLANSYPVNMLYFNILSDNNNKPYYNPHERILKIDTDIFQIAIIDGIHRITAAMEVIDIDNEFQGEFLLKITNTSIKQAQMFIRQESKGKNAPDIMKKFNYNNKITSFIKNINEMGSEVDNILYRRIDFEVNTTGTRIQFEDFEEGLYLSGFMNDISKTDKANEYHKIGEFIVRFFNDFYKVVKDNKINKNRKDVYTDPTFIMGLLITCHRYYEKNNYDIEIMCKGAEKIKKSSTKFTSDYPINNRREKMLWENRFQRLFEKFDKEINDEPINIYDCSINDEHIAISRDVLDEDIDNINDILNEMPANIDTPCWKGEKTKKEFTTSNVAGKQKPKRNPVRALNALMIANYLCEYDNQDRVFLRKNNLINYTEPHHLIPISKHSDFEYNLDVEENIISLCSHCHNLLHYGRMKDKEKILKKLYDQRKLALESVGLELKDFNHLKSYYQ